MKPSLILRLHRGKETVIRDGFPWVYKGDYADSSALLLEPAGSLCIIETARGEFLGVGYFNPHSHIACRVLSLKEERIDAAWFETRLRNALVRRERVIDAPYYRLVHAEADFLPGLVIDRFGDIIVVQAAAAGMELLQPLWQEALMRVLTPRSIVLRNDGRTRSLEGLPQEINVIGDSIPEVVEVLENSCIYHADLIKGQKTGWFYDQRDNRAMMASLSGGKTLLDVYSHSGGFGLLAAKAGATSVTLADSSSRALELAEGAAKRNGIAENIQIEQGDAFAIMADYAKKGRKFNIVLVDPPAFVKTRKDIESGMKGYTKAARLAAPLVAEGGHMFIASCSHHASLSRFQKAVLDGVAQAGVDMALIKATGHAPDHPLHPRLPQGGYLKGLLLKRT